MARYCYICNTKVYPGKQIFVGRDVVCSQDCKDGWKTLQEVMKWKESTQAQDLSVMERLGNSAQSVTSPW